MMADSEASPWYMDSDAIYRCLTSYIKESYKVPEGGSFLRKMF